MSRTSPSASPRTAGPFGTRLAVISLCVMLAACHAANNPVTNPPEPMTDFEEADIFFRQLIESSLSRQIPENTR